MIDPVFTNRADLVAWVKQRLRYPDPSPDAQFTALDDIRRVALAHLHLPEDKA